MKYRIEYTDLTAPDEIAREDGLELAEAKRKARQLSAKSAKHGTPDGVYVVATEEGHDVGHIAYFSGLKDHIEGRIS